MPTKARGRKPLTDQQRAARGELVPGVNTPQPIAGYPECPSWLTGAARECWNALVPILDDLGVLSKSDVMQIAITCTYFARWQEAEAEIARNAMRNSEKTGEKDTGLFAMTQAGWRQKDAACTLATEMMVLLGKSLTQFGLTPLARSHVTVQLTKQKDEMAEFLAKRMKG